MMPILNINRLWCALSFEATNYVAHLFNIRCTLINNVFRNILRNFCRWDVAFELVRRGYGKHQSVSRSESDCVRAAVAAVLSPPSSTLSWHTFTVTPTSHRLPLSRGRFCKRMPATRVRWRALSSIILGFRNSTGDNIYRVNHWFSISDRRILV